MKKVYLITPMAEDFPVDVQADYIGIDAGYLKVLEKNLPLVQAVGDFDSMDARSIPEGFEVYPTAKDETDSQLAMELAVKMGYESIVLWGGISGRLDHTLANLRLISWTYPQVILADHRQKAFVLLEGEHLIPPDSRHLSIFALEPSVISESNVQYCLDHQALDEKDVFTVSNSFLKGDARITVHSGRVLCIASNLR